VQSFQRNCMQWARPAQENAWDPPPRNGAWAASFDSATDDEDDDANWGGNTSIVGRNWPRTAGGDTRQGGTGPLHVPALGFVGIGKQREDVEGLAAAAGPGTDPMTSFRAAVAGENPSPDLQERTSSAIPELAEETASQNLEAGVGKPISFQKSWANSSSDLPPRRSRTEPSRASAECT
jgi:hypothetical protein